MVWGKVATVIVPISHTLHTESTLSRIYWFLERPPTLPPTTHKEEQ